MNLKAISTLGVFSMRKSIKMKDVSFQEIEKNSLFGIQKVD